MQYHKLMKMDNQFFYKNIDLRIATQNDIALMLNLPCVFISIDPETETEERILELFCFAEGHNLNDLLNQLESIYFTILK